MCQWMTLQEFSTLEFKTQFSKSTLTLELRVIMALKQLIDSGQVRFIFGGANLTWVKLLEAVAKSLQNWVAGPYQNGLAGMY